MWGVLALAVLILAATAGVYVYVVRRHRERYTFDPIAEPQDGVEAEPERGPLEKSADR